MRSTTPHIGAEPIIFNGMGFVYIFLLFIFKCLSRDQGLVLCVGVVKTPRRSNSIRCNARIRDDNPTGHGGHGGGSCPIRRLESI